MHEEEEITRRDVNTTPSLTHTAAPPLARRRSGRILPPHEPLIRQPIVFEARLRHQQLKKEPPPAFLTLFPFLFHSANNCLVSPTGAQIRARPHKDNPNLISSPPRPSLFSFPSLSPAEDATTLSPPFHPHPPRLIASLQSHYSSCTSRWLFFARRLP